MEIKNFIFEKLNSDKFSLDELFFQLEREVSEDAIITQDLLYDELKSLELNGLVHMSKGKWVKGADPKLEQKKNIEEQVVISQEAQKRWSDFRRLLGYYIECVRFDEKSSYKLFKEKANKQWISISMFREWTCLLENESLEIPLSEEHSSFVLNVITQKEEQLFIGYPVHVVKTPKHNFSVPIYCIPVSRRKLNGTTLEIALDYESTDVNSDWLEYACPNREARDHFLKVAGLRDPGGVELEDDVDENETSDGQVEVKSFDINRLIDALRLFHGESLNGRKLDPSFISPLDPIIKLGEGMHNGMVVFTGKKLRYAASLVRELRRLQNHAKDEEFEQSALKFLFFPLEKDSQAEAYLKQETPIVFPVLDLTQSQFRAVCNSGAENLSVVTGPPGTGKSQVVSVALASTLLDGSTGVFASRNKSALDAVVPRLNSISEGLPVIRRNKDNDLGNLEWDKLIDEIISNPTLNSNVLEELESKKNLCRSKSNQLATQIKEYDEFLAQKNKIDSLFWKNEEILHKEPYKSFDFGILLKEDFEKALSDFIEILKNNPGIFKEKKPYLWKFWLIPKFRKNQKRIHSLVAKIYSFSGFPESFFDPETEDHLIILRKMEVLLKDLLLLESFEKAIDTQKANFDEIEHRNKCIQLIEELKSLSITTLRLQLKVGLHSYDDNERQLLSTAKVMIKQLDNAISDQTVKELSRQLEVTFETLISKVPLLAVTNLSTMSVFPSTTPCQFDLLVVDEASQCDIPSTIPLLFRAKRVCVIGDPKQLKAIHSIKESMHTHLKEKSRLLDAKFAPYDYLSMSFFDLANHWCKEDQRTMLKEHFRCHSRIADYCNDISYNNELYVLTDEDRLRGEFQGRRGLYWGNIVGDCDRAPGGGSRCLAEAEEVVAIVCEMEKRKECNFTLGVVSPFKAQANLIKEKLEAKLSTDTWKKMRLRVATADGFQGDERDVIIFSITCQPNMKRGSLWFIAQEKNRWNVAVSRAKSLLYIVGNKNFCKDSDIPHVRRLAEHADIENSHEGKKFDSIWEEKFFNVLEKAGVETVPQHPIAGYRLDLAIPNLKIDIEVDGVQYHRDEFGNRKPSDFWRDMTIENLGWSVIRFWVYELNENMPGCIKKVQNMIKIKSNK